MSAQSETILFVFGLVALGYAAGWLRYFKPGVGEAMTSFAVGVALPALLFRTMVNADFHGAAPWRFWAAYFSAVAVAWTCGHLVTTRVFGRDSQAGVVGGVSTAFSNIVLLGIPVISTVYGEQGFEILSLLISVHLPTMIMTSIVLFEVFGKRDGEVHVARVFRDFFRKIYTNPLVIGIALGVVWRVTGLPMPSIAMRLIDSLASVASTVALFAMGLSLYSFGISGNVRPAMVLSALKLMLMPAIALPMALLFGLPPMSAKVAVICAALPSGINSYLIANQFGTGQALASNQMTIATAAGAITIAFWLAVVEQVFG